MRVRARVEGRRAPSQGRRRSACRGGCEWEERRLCPPGHRGAVRPGGRCPGAGACPGPLAVDRRGAPSDGGGGRGRVSPPRQPAAGRGRRGAGGPPRRDRGALGGRAGSRLDRRADRAPLRPLHRGDPPPDRRRAPACTARAGPRRTGSGGRRRDRRGAVGGRSVRARGRDRGRRDRRVPERPARRARGPDHPDQGSGDRHGAAGRAPVREPALRASRLRLLAPDGGRADRGRRLPRRVAGTRSSRPRRH